MMLCACILHSATFQVHCNCRTPNHDALHSCFVISTWCLCDNGLHLHRTVSDFAMGDNLLGLVVAALSVVSSGMQQIFCRSMQQKHKLSSHELLSNTAPAQVHSCQPHEILAREP
jgi:hypothetical protein